jgi:hypothetical protein
MSLTLMVEMTFGKGGPIGRKPVSYTVAGLPRGERATISEIDHEWRIVRVRNGASRWRSGGYASAQDALNALECECSQAE